MRVGTVCYATEQGLGYLAYDFYKAGVVTDPVVIRHSSRPTHDAWYPGALIADRPQRLTDQTYPFLDTLARCDVVLFFETPFDWALIPALRRRGVRTVMMPMYECMPAEWPERPDAIINPSRLDQRYYPAGEFIPVPAPSGWLVQRQRGRAKVFVHNAGHGGLRGRNGTAEVIEALRYVKTPARFLIRCQDGDLADKSVPFGNRGMMVQWAGPLDRRTLYTEGDVFLFPEKFNGLSLPLQEAFSAGMLVMCGERFPMTTWLPQTPMIRPSGTIKARVSPRCVEFDEAIYDPRAIAAAVDEWYGKDISLFSYEGLRWARDNGWDKLKPKYLATLAGSA